MRAAVTTSTSTARVVWIRPGVRPLILQEVGYPASTLLGSSEQQQAQFVTNVFDAWAPRGDRIPFLNVFLMHDFPQTLCDYFTQYYGLPGNERFSQFLCTLGLRKANGTPRLAWTAFVVLVLTGIWNIAAAADTNANGYQLTLGFKLAAVLLSGCESMQYYAQAIGGHLSVMHASRPVESWLADPAWHAPTGGELAITIAQRSLRAIDEIKQQYTNGNVLVVSHKATIRIILCALLGIDVGRFRYRLACPVGSLSVIEFSPAGPMLQSLADRSHLSETLQSLPGT